MREDRDFFLPDRHVLNERPVRKRRKFSQEVQALQKAQTSEMMATTIGSLSRTRLKKWRRALRMPSCRTVSDC